MIQKPCMDQFYEGIEDQIWNMMQKCFGLSVKRGNQKCFFSLVKIGFLKFRVIFRTREKDVFIEANNWLREKTRLPFEIADPRFHSAARPQNSTAEWVPREQGKHRRFHSAVSFGGFMTADYDRRLRPREINRPDLNGGFERRSMAADRNRRN